VTARGRRRALPVVLLLVAACAAPHRPPRPPRTEPPAGDPGIPGPLPPPPLFRPAGVDQVLATAHGLEVRCSDLGRRYLELAPEAARAEIRRLLLGMALEEEAGALGIGLEGEEARRERLFRELLDEARAHTGREGRLAAYAEERHGRSPDALLAERVRADRERELWSKMIRYFALRETLYDLELISVDSEEEATRIGEELRQGAEFGPLARARSRHPSGAGGGRIGALPLAALSDAAQGAVAALAEGAVSRWVRAERPPAEGASRFLVFRLRRRIPGRPVAYPEVRAGIESGLIERAIDLEEWKAWSLYFERRYGFRFVDGGSATLPP
jgi:hypothetical protein